VRKLEVEQVVELEVEQVVELEVEEARSRAVVERSVHPRH
jgi:hypothetical protein